MRAHATTILCSAIVAAALLGAAPEAQAKQHRYVGEHPIDAGVFCHIHAPHVHTVAPVKAEILYRPHDGWHHFVGDPTPYGWEGERSAYAGPHPIHVDVVLGETEVDGDELEYCYLRGAHYHMHAPPPDTHFSVRADVNWYVGTLPPEFEVERPRRARINVVYASFEYARPVIEVGPPPGWVDVYVGVDVPTPGVIVDARVATRGPEFIVPAAPRVEAGIGLHVEVPLPVLEVRIGGAPLVVHEHHGHHDHDHHHHGKRKVVKAKGWGGHGHGHVGGSGSVKVKVKAKGHAQAKGRF